MSVFNGALLAKGWLSVALASASDTGRPVLDNTVYVESYPSGVRLIATDTYIVLRTFVPAVGFEDDPEPSLDEIPVANAISIDPHGRALGFLKYALKLAKDTADAEVTMTLGVVEAADTDTLLGMESKWLILEMPDRERVRLLTCEGQYPDWRRLGLPFTPKRTTVVALMSDRLDQIAKLAKIHGLAVGWTFGGNAKPAAVEVIDSHPFIEGLVMPCRWDVIRNEPLADAEPEDAERAEGDDDAEVTITHTPADGSEPTTVKTTLGKISQIGDKPKRSRRKPPE